MCRSLSSRILPLSSGHKVDKWKIAFLSHHLNPYLVPSCFGFLILRLFVSNWNECSLQGSKCFSERKDDEKFAWYNETTAQCALPVFVQVPESSVLYCAMCFNCQIFWHDAQMQASIRQATTYFSILNDIVSPACCVVFFSSFLSFRPVVTLGSCFHSLLSFARGLLGLCCLIFRHIIN